MTTVSLSNRTKVNTATTGTGTVTLGVATANNYCTFAEGGITDGQTVRYEINEGTDFEIGTGVYTASGTTMTRATVTLSKISGTSGTTKMSLGGTATVSIVAVKEDFYYQGGTLVAQTDGGTAAPDSGFHPANVGLVATAAGSALTIALKGANGSDPSATNPVIVPFRNVTEATGTPTDITVTAATSLVISSGSTLGVTSSTAFRLWVVGFNDGGTFRLGVMNATTCTTTACTIHQIADWMVDSAVSEGGAGAADLAQTFYANATVTSKAYRVLGFLEWNATGLTAGTWTTTNLNRIQIFGPGVHLPGQVVQTISTTGAVTNFTTSSATYVFATSNSASITPLSAANVIFVNTAATLDNEANSAEIEARLSRGTTANTNMIGNEGDVFCSSIVAVTIQLHAVDKPNTTSAQSYGLQARAALGTNVQVVTPIGVWILHEVMA